MKPSKTTGQDSGGGLLAYLHVVPAQETQHSTKHKTNIN